MYDKIYKKCSAERLNKEFPKEEVISRTFNRWGYSCMRMAVFCNHIYLLRRLVLLQFGHAASGCKGGSIIDRAVYKAG